MLISLFDFDSCSSCRLPTAMFWLEPGFSSYYSFIMNADLAIFLAFLKTNTSLINKKIKAKSNPKMEITMNTM